MTPKKNVLILNGSIRGTRGNSQKISKIARETLKISGLVKSSIVNLSEASGDTSNLYSLLENADGFLVVTGTYWNNWGSPLQKFIETATAFENSPAFFGKPIACAVTIDSVGGIEVATRLHGAFAGLGCWSPPCSTIVISRVGQEAITASAKKPNDPNDDVWRIEDLDVVLKNLVAATSIKTEWTSWPFIKLKKDLNSPKFL
jgi:NAD(P)H-dependent FMN reductase